MRSYARRLSEHATNPILRLPGNVLPEEDDDDNESSVVSAEDQPTIETSVSSTGSIAIRSPSPFVRPSNPQSRFLDSSGEGSVTAPTVREATPLPSRRRPALAQISNAPRTGRPSPSRTPMKVGRVQGVEPGVPTPPPSLRPKLAKRAGRYPLTAPTTRLKDESGSPSRPARNCVSLHFADCIFTILILFSASFLQVPSVERLDRNFSERIEMTRMSSHTLPRWDSRIDQRCIGVDGLWCMRLVTGEGLVR